MMDTLTLDVERHVAALLTPGEFPTEIVRTAYDRNGGTGDGYLVLTPHRVVVGDRPTTGEPSFRAFALDEVAGLEVRDEGFTRGTAQVVGTAGPLDAVVFSGFERARIDAFATQLEAAKRDARGAAANASPATGAAAPAPPPPPPRSDDDDWSQPMRPSRPASVQTEEQVPMAIVLSDAPRSSGKTATKKGLYLHLERETYAPGETVRGRLLLHWPNDGPVRGVWWDVAGAETTHVSVQRGSGKNRHTVTYRERRPVIDGGLVVFGQRKSGFFGLVWEGMRAFVGLHTDNPILRAGEYAYDFEFTLPDDAPPTWKGNNSEVRYEINARVDIPGAFDLTTGAVLNVLCPPQFYVEGFLDEHRPKTGLAGLFTAEVEMQVEVPPGRFRPGEDLPFTVRVKNLGGKRVRGLNVHLGRREAARARGHLASTTKTESTLRIPEDRLALDGTPVSAAISTPDRFLILNGRYCQVYWELRVELDVAWGFDAVVTEPLGVRIER